MVLLICWIGFFWPLVSAGADIVTRSLWPFTCDRMQPTVMVGAFDWSKAQRAFKPNGAIASLPLLTRFASDVYHEAFCLFCLSFMMVGGFSLKSAMALLYALRASSASHSFL